MLRLLAGREQPGQGEVVVQATGGVGHPAQDEQPAAQATVQRVIDRALLDDPTNHLSPALAEELETAPTGYNGTLVIVSQDRRPRRHWRGAHPALPAPETSAATW